MRSLLDPPTSLAPIPKNFGQRFLVTVDTEEEFDWSAALSRSGHSTRHVTEIPRFQALCESHGIKPVYLVDWPITQSPAAASILGDAVRRNAASIGMQLHAWVNPPFAEQLTPQNSFAGNLPPALEREKLLRLKSAIEDVFGMSPRIYRAGRYGVGPHTAAILAEAGVAIDSSVRAHFDYSTHGGADFSRHPASPYWLNGKKNLLELPLTTVFTGALERWGPRIFPSLWRIPRIRGVLGATKMLNRVPFTPEGTNFFETICAIDQAIEIGLPVLVFSMHSPSLQPGNTPYIRTERELESLYFWWQQIFAHLEKKGIQPAIRKKLCTGSAFSCTTVLASRKDPR